MLLNYLHVSPRQTQLNPNYNPHGLGVGTEGIYVYRRLEARDSIRLFQLDPGRLDDPIQGQVFHVSLDSKQDYETLSYSWGDPAIHHKIFTHDGVIPTTASVQSALKRFRFQDRTRILWVDAFGINQSNNEEKSGQILLMLKTYSSALRVVVYLGKHADNSRSAIKLMEKISKTTFYSLPGKIVSDSALTTVDLSHGHDKIWRALRDLGLAAGPDEHGSLKNSYPPRMLYLSLETGREAGRCSLTQARRPVISDSFNGAKILPPNSTNLWMQLLAQWL
jgi:hypothetical protein